MNDLRSFVRSYVEQLIGPEGEQAFHTLIESEPTIIPYLVEAFQAETNSITRSILVQIIGQYRLPETLQFLSHALTAGDPQVWKSALDGIVTVGGDPAIQALESTKQRILIGNKKDYSIRAQWIDEAIQQIRDQTL